MSIKALYNDTAFCYRVSTTADEHGCAIETTALVATLSCRCNYLSGGKQVFAGKRQVVATHRVWMPTHDAVAEDCRLYLPNDDLQLDVLKVYRVRGYAANVHHMEVLCEELGGVPIGGASSSSESDDSSGSSSSQSQSSSSQSSSSSSQGSSGSSISSVSSSSISQSSASDSSNSESTEEDE